MADLIKTKKSILKLIKEAEATFENTGKPLLDIEDYVAEYLAANGVIVPPCKVGDKVYYVHETLWDNDYKNQVINDNVRNRILKIVYHSSLFLAVFKKN